MESATKNRAAVFALTRGYSGFGKVRYLRLILRNHSLRRALGCNRVDYLLFHEGNISVFEQKILTRISGIPLRFVDVGDVFRCRSQDVWTGTSDFGLGYSLMCRFNYEHVWDLLEDYEIAYRVDEDVVVMSLPLPDSRIDSEMLVGCLTEEIHARTNSTLPEKLGALGSGRFYDHRFPYTNCYVTKLAFWRRPDVRQFLRAIGNDPMSIENRWGDLPVLGVALRAMSAWDPESSVDPRIRYVHGSHRASVREGRLHCPDSLLRHKELGWIGWVLALVDAVGRLTATSKGAFRRWKSAFNGSGNGQILL